jgi:sulfite reductase beta subunit-like hemoprotein
MEKIARLLSIIDDPVADKLIMLDRLVQLYAKFTETWREAEVRSDGATVRIKWLRINKYGYESFTERVFPIEDVGKRIASYKRKIKKEFTNRHENVRIQREKDTRKWQKHIDNADIHL